MKETKIRCDGCGCAKRPDRPDHGWLQLQVAPIYGVYGGERHLCPACAGELPERVRPVERPEAWLW